MRFQSTRDQSVPGLWRLSITTFTEDPLSFDEASSDLRGEYHLTFSTSTLEYDGLDESLGLN